MNVMNVFWGHNVESLYPKQNTHFYERFYAPKRIWLCDFCEWWIVDSKRIKISLPEMGCRASPIKRRFFCIHLKKLTELGDKYFTEYNINSRLSAKSGKCGNFHFIHWRKPQKDMRVPCEYVCVFLYISVLFCVFLSFSKLYR